MAGDLDGVIGGFDCHLDFHVAVALDSLGQLLGAEAFPATSDGYRKALCWIRGFGPVVAVGVESTGSYGPGLSRFFAREGLQVIEVNQPHAHTRARRGKDDAIDAEAAARKVLSGEAAGAAKDSRGIVESIRELTVARTSATKARTAALCQFRDLVITVPAAIRENLAVRKTLERKAKLCVRIRPGPGTPTNPANAAKIALRSVARRIQHLGEEIKELDAQLEKLIAIAAPGTQRRLGLGTQNTATLLTAAGENIDRFSSEASFAHLCGAVPIPATSGRTTRHRLNHAGNRQANRALHMIAIVRLRY